MSKKTVSLIILDGFGINVKNEGNAVYKAKKPNINRLLEKYPNATMKTSGLDVGLPDGQMGNSEVGHTNIGSGRVVYQELTRITKSIKDGDFFEKVEFINAINHCRENGTNLHLYGLLSDGGVHSHNTHLYGLLKLCKIHDFNRVYIHCFLDGRDVPPNSAAKFVQELQDEISEIGVGKIASVMGRYYAMDRDNRWERVELAFSALTLGEGETATDPVKAIKDSYEMDVFDEFVKPTVIHENDEPIATIKKNDSIIFFNFRPDRAREITKAFIEEDFSGFKRQVDYLNPYYVCFTQYDKTYKNVSVAFKPQSLKNTFGEYISKLGYKQLRIAETEKYAHVTFFFNGGVEVVYEGEDRCLINSPKVATYDMQPEMSAYEVTDEVVKRINSQKYDVIILNYANPDMVGHTGDLDAAVKAIETVDECLGKVMEAIENNNGVALITADHGNAEKMIDYDTNGAYTAHTTFPVPIIVCGVGDVQLREGRLADIAPTILDIMNIEKPEEMVGESIIIK